MTIDAIRMTPERLLSKAASAIGCGQAEHEYRAGSRLLLVDLLSPNDPVGHPAESGPGQKADRPRDHQ